MEPRPAFSPDNSPEAKERRRLALAEGLEARVIAQLKEGHKYVFPSVVELHPPSQPNPDALAA